MKDITESVVITEADHLFNVSTMETQIKETKGKAFHRAMERLLFMCKILRPDIHPAVEFLNTRVKDTTEEYWKIW